MLNALRTALVATAIIAATGAAHAATNPQAVYGEAVAGSAAARQVTITADTKSVNVNDGDTVAFNVNGKTFTWHFDTLRGMGSFDLAKIAPAGVDTGMTNVYVASNPLYRG
ncbi:CzcE family metal-binding protein [Pseudoduganella sp. FT26W]|uniref:CzcE family metal-binding protein n=1 Tax=Duganella aquatilis TaxID=2666082 RepID=A0A844D962_9BURK|nr:CzcE family metal-binding protein [Duganella aquatilis]MRW87501.1 CzcE family metal-binding protein [Duganella aquatilis]